MRQLIYTSVARGLTPGQSGYCTVARSRDLREALVTRLEKLSYYAPEPNQNPVICAYRILEIRGAHFHVLTRITDAGLDFTKRRSFLAHHLVFEPSEIVTAPSPAEIFLKWNGWRDGWEGEPQWIENGGALELAANRRDDFLERVQARGASWGLTFTNQVQPGDHAEDFRMTPAFEGSSLDPTPGRASVPASLGAGESAPLDAESSRGALAGQTSPSHTNDSPSREAKFKKPSFWAPTLTGGLMVIAFVAAMVHRNRSPDPGSSAVTTAIPVATRPEPSHGLLFPDRPTWVVVEKEFSPVPPVEKLMRQLRVNEVFTKDLRGSVQTNLFAPAVPASLFADVDKGFIRFAPEQGPQVELSANLFNTTIENSFAVEIEGHFRLMALTKPIVLGREFLHAGEPVELERDLKQKLQQLQLPRGAQLALRPVPDPFADLENDFGLVPSLSLDLKAIHARTREVIDSRQAKLEKYQAEFGESSAEKTKVITNENEKVKERRNVLEMAISKAETELAELKRKAEAIPNRFSVRETFAVFLCLSNVNTEIVRFVEP